jgi:hypothetical protein
LKAEARVRPAGDQPAHVADDGVNILDILLDGIGIVETQVALSVLLPRDAEIQADRLGVADVQVPIGFRRESGHDLRVLPGCDVGRDNVTDKVARNGRG